MTELYPYAQEAQALAWALPTFEDSLITAVKPADAGGFIPQVWILGTKEHWDWGPVASRDRAWELAAELEGYILKDFADRDKIETMCDSLH